MTLGVLVKGDDADDRRRAPSDDSDELSPSTTEMVDRESVRDVICDDDVRSDVGSPLSSEL